MSKKLAALAFALLATQSHAASKFVNVDVDDININAYPNGYVLISTHGQNFRDRASDAGDSTVLNCDETQPIAILVSASNRLVAAALFALRSENPNRRIGIGWTDEGILSDNRCLVQQIALGR